MQEPFLFRFKRECQSPSRIEPDSSYRYDLLLDMVLDQGVIPPLPAIESTRSPGPITKKEDIEKGEDAKDRRMW